MPFASFDFKLYLKEIDPTEEYDITTLTGGLINLTVRATKTAAGSGVFPDHRSIVLKHAPPFVASIGESAPFSPFRQVVEGLALKFLAESDDIRTGCLEAGVSVPTLLHEDHNRHVIAISDLGDDLCTVDQEIAETTPSDARLVGERVGRWMGVLHSLPMSPKTLQMFENKETTALIGREVVDRMKEALEIFGVDVEESKRLCDLMRGQVEMQAGKTAFCLGDFWTGSILTDRRGKLGIVDWEFAGGGRVLQDMGQIGAVFNSDRDVENAFMSEGMYVAHRKEMDKRNSGWLDDQMTRLSIIQDTWILHGREIIDHASRLKAEGAESGRIQSVAQKGLWYLRTASRGITEDDITKETFLRPLYMA